MKIYLGADHAGFQMKEYIKNFLMAQSYEIVDCGAKEFTGGDDYPDYILPVARMVANDWRDGINSLSVVCGGSGQGEAMVANRVEGVRCAVYYGGSRDIITLSREHNNANMLSLGARFVAVDEAEEIVKLWLATSFSGDERHVRRLGKF